MKNNIFITLLFLCMTIVVQAQVLPSPDASSQVKNSNIPVNLYTGVASVSVPLYTVQSNTGGSVPIGLQYNAGGIKVREIAGSAGLGWHLQAGGAITRVMRDRPDEQRAIAPSFPTADLAEDMFMNGSSVFDKERDIFYFSFPGGQGRIVMSSTFSGGPCYEVVNGVSTEVPCEYDDVSMTLTNSNLKTLPATDYRVQFVKNGKTDSHWIITDLAGNTYHFGETSGSREVTVANTKEGTNAYDPNNELEYVSTWRLNKIDYYSEPVGEEITFDYNFNRQLVEENVSTQTRLTLNGSEPNLSYSPQGVVYTYTSKTTTSARFVSNINFSKGELLFSYKEREDDNNNLALSKVIVEDHNNVEVSYYDFDHTYFNAEDSYYKNGKNTASSSEKWKRLKLDKIEKDGYAYRVFDYTSNKEFEASGADRFELPPRDSKYFDHWGYFNGRNNQGTTYVDYASNVYPTLGGMDRSPRISCTSNMLSKVVFPLGGYQTLTYGLNVKNGGPRIEAIKTFDEEDNLVTHRSYTYAAADENESLDIEYIGPQPVDNDGPSDQSFAYSNALSLQYSLNGPTSGYAKVTVTNELLDNYDVHYFYNRDDFELTPPQQTEYQFTYKPSLGAFTTPIVTDPSEIRFSNEYPYVNHSLENYLYGSPKATKRYDENGDLIAESDFSYDEVSTGGILYSSVYTVRVIWTENGPQDDVWIYKNSSYNISPKYVRLTSKTDKSYDQNVLIATNTTTYNYDNLYKTLPISTSTERTDNTGGEAFDSETYMYYPFDESSLSKVHSSVDLGKMRLVHAIGNPIQTEKKIKLPGYTSFKTSEASVSTFRDQHSIVQPYQSFALELASPSNSWTESDFRLIGTSSFNAQGLLESQTGTDEIETRYTYDSEGYLISTTVDPGPTALERSTSYTHKPLVGVTSVTGPDGKTISSVYDSRNRLHLVYDEDNHVVERYRYSTADENNNLSGGVGIAGINLVNSTLDFTLENLRAYGEEALTDVKLNIDGVEHNATSVSTSFSSEGNYEYRLTLINPEYDEPFNFSSSLEIYDQMLEADIFGVPTYDACDHVQGTTIAFSQRENKLGATRSNGAGFSISYKWEYKASYQNNWTTFGTSNSADFPETFLLSAGTFSIRLTITDAAGYIYVDTNTLTVTEDCGGGGGPQY